MTNILDPNQQSFEDAGLSPDLNVWLTRNLTALQRAGLSTGLTYDYANADSSVLRTLNETDPNVPSPAKPSVLGTVFGHVMNTQNHLVPVGDMKTYQDKLASLGYMPPGYQSSGVYDPQTANAHRLLGDTVAQQINSGEGGFMSSTPGKALDLLFNASMPTHIAKGIFGMVKNLVTSAFGTAKRLGGLVSSLAPGGETPTEALKDVYHHLGEDALNVLSVVGMFSGISEVFDAGRAGLGLLGAVDSTGGAAAEWLAKHGIEEGAAAFSRPAAEELMANPSIANRIAQWGLKKVPGVGGQMADSFGETVARYGPRAINEIPAMKVLRGVYSGTAKAAFIPQVAAIYDSHGKLGKAVNAAPTLPWYADLPAMVVHPLDGTIPKVKDFMRLFRISDFGHLDPLRGLTSEPIPDNIRTMLNSQAYAKYQAARAVGQSAKSASALVDSEPGVMGEEFSKAMHAEIGGNALHDAENPARGVRPEYQQAANAWAEQHPYLIRKHFLEITTSAQFREAQGLTGHNPISDYLEATNAANTLTAHIQQSLPAFVEADKRVQEAQKRLDELKSVFNPEDRPAADALLPKDLKFSMGPGPWQNAITRAANDLADAKQEAQQASIAHLVPAQEPVLAGYNYDRTPIMMAPESPGVATTKRVLIMRGDNPADRAGLLDLLKRWNGTDAAGQAALQPELNRLNLGAVHPSRVAVNLEAMARVAAEDITDRLPPEWQQQFRSLGYKAVLGGHDVLLPTDIDPTALSATKYGKLAYGLASFGLSPIAADQRDIAALTRSARARALDEYLFSQAGGAHPLGSGTAVLQAAERQRLANLDALENMAQQSRGQRMLARMQKTFQAHEITVPEYQQGLTQALGVDKGTAANMAPEIAHVMRQAAASPGVLRSPNETYGVLARLGDSLRVHGWQGFSEYIRSIQVGKDGRWGSGALHKLPFNHYGDLPNNLLKGAMSLRFSLNPMFEARYAAKQPFLTMTAEDLPYELLPKRAMARLSGASGRDVQSEANTILARARGGNPKQLDDMEKQALDSGIFGYNAQNHQKYDAWRLYQREYMKAGGTAEELRGLAGNGGDFAALNSDADRAAIKYLQDDPKHVIAGGYGARAPLEKSINSVFFPFSFEKKLLTQTADWFSAEPVRVMLAHHTMQMVNQWDKIGPDHQSKIARVVKKYVPVFNEVQKLNAFAHGVSPGEFGGVYGPLAQSMGVGVGAVMGAFHPVGVHNTNADKFQKLLPRLVPGWNAVHNAFNDAIEQGQIAVGAKSETTKAQIDDYFTKLRDMEQQASDTALIFGATPSVRGFTDSQQVPQALKSQYEQEKMILQQRYPDAAAYALKYGDTQAANDLAIQTVLGKVQKSPLDNGVLAMEVLRSQLGSLPTAQNGGAPAAQLLQRQLEQTTMRNEGLRLYNILGPAWNDLWIHLGYQHEFGPITEEAV